MYEVLSIYTSYILLYDMCGRQKISTRRRDVFPEACVTSSRTYHMRMPLSAHQTAVFLQGSLESSYHTYVSSYTCNCCRNAVSLSLRLCWTMKTNLCLLECTAAMILLYSRSISCVQQYIHRLWLTISFYREYFGTCILYDINRC